MNPDEAVEIIQSKFGDVGRCMKVDLLKKKGKGYFCATLVDGGVRVDNLGSQPFLPWAVFEETARLLNHSAGGRALRGNAMT